MTMIEEPFIQFGKEIQDLSYKTWICRHGQKYLYNVESEKWKVIKFVKSFGNLGCDCEVPCSPAEAKALLVLERHLNEICREIGPCPRCGPGVTSTILAAWPGHLVTIQCDHCGDPRIIKPIEIWEKLEVKNEKKREMEYQLRDAKNRAAHFTESIKMNIQNIQYYNANKAIMIEEAKKQKELEIKNRIMFFTKELKENKEKLKKINQVLKIGGQTKLF